MQSSVMCGVRVNMMERRPLVAVGQKNTDRIRDSTLVVHSTDVFHTCRVDWLEP